MCLLNKQINENKEEKRKKNAKRFCNIQRQEIVLRNNREERRSLHGNKDP